MSPQKEEFLTGEDTNITLILLKSLILNVFNIILIF